MTQESDDAIRLFQEVFGEEDGGIELRRFRAHIAELERANERGDKNAMEMLRVFHRFARLVHFMKR